jgi:phage-related protein (TIGR01555 family)
MAGSPILDASGAPIAAPTSSPVRYFGDGITEAIQFAATPMHQFGSVMTRMFGPQLAYAAYCESGMMQRVIELPASDRVREWRDWQADQDQIEKLEKEEKRLGLVAKVKAAEILRGIGGGALILVAGGSPSQPINVTGVGGLVAINVVHKDQITLVDIDQELSSPNYGLPRAFKIGSEQTEIHPSRVVCFRGDPLMVGYGVGLEQAFWGRSRLMRVFKEVQKSDDTQAWFAALVRKAKLLRIGIPSLTDAVAAPGGQDRMNRRMSAIALSESVLNATVYDSGDGQGAGEKIEDYQVSWAGIPAMMDAFDQRVAAVSGIPFTVLQGRSPGGMNATGTHDERNWNREVQQGQKLELAPCLDQIDAALIPSALGSRPEEIWWQFAPLSTPSEAEETTRFKTWTEAAESVRASGTVPDEAFAKAYQNTVIENGWMPGLDGALDELPDDERFGLNPDDDGTDPSAIAAEGGDPNLEGGGGANGSVPPRRAANDAVTGFFADAAPRPLYVQRKLLNGAALIAWAKDNGFKSTLSADDLHVTVLYSKTAVDPMRMGESWAGDENGRIRVKPGGPRAIERFGENAVVLLFASWELESRHRTMVEAGGSHDFDSYHPHITLSYEVPDGVDLTVIKPYAGALEFGEELFEPLDLDWKRKVTEE